MKTKLLFIIIHILIAFNIIITHPAKSQQILGDASEIFIFNKTQYSITVEAATTNGKIQWERLTGSTFQYTNQYATGKKFDVSPNYGDWGWDFVDDNAHNGSAHGGILAYSKYKIQIASDIIYIDLRDSRYNSDAGLDRGLDWYLYYYGNDTWKYGRGPGFPEYPIDEELGIWQVYAELSYPPSQNAFKVPVTVKTNFTNGNIIVNGNA